MNVLLSKRDFTPIPNSALVWDVQLLSFSDFGGPSEARLTCSGSREDIAALPRMLRFPVDVYNDDGSWVWGGYINDVEAVVDGFALSVSLDSQASKVAVAYSSIAQTEGATSAGFRAVTGWAEDARATSIFGIRELLVSASGMTDSSALALRDRTLALQKSPRGFVDLRSSDKPTATVVCRGWFSTFNWRMASWPSVAKITQLAGTDSLSFGNLAASTAVGQQFTLTDASARVLSVTCYLSKTGAPTDLVEARLYATTSTGMPTGLALASCSISGSSLSTAFSAVTFAFATPVSCPAGTMFAIVLKRSGALNSSNYYQVQRTSSSAYPDNRLVVWNGSVWADYGVDCDLKFSVRVDNLVAGEQQIADLYAAYNQFLTGIIFEPFSMAESSSFRVGDATCLEEFAILASLGTTNGVKVLMRVTEDRKLIVYEQPLPGTTEVVIRADGTMYNVASGQVVGLSGFVPGFWAQVETALFSSDSDLLVDPAYQYVRGGEYYDGKFLPLFSDASTLVQRTPDLAPELRAAVQGIAGKFVPLNPFVVSTTMPTLNGTPVSTQSKQDLDLSYAFGLPSGISAVLFQIFVRDSGSLAALEPLGIMFYTDDDSTYYAAATCNGTTNDSKQFSQVLAVCDQYGNLQYATAASGSLTLDVFIRVIGYYV